MLRPAGLHCRHGPYYAQCIRLNSAQKHAQSRRFLYMWRHLTRDTMTVRHRAGYWDCPVCLSFCIIHTFHRRTRTAYLCNRCLAWYNVLVQSSVKSQFSYVRQTKYTAADSCDGGISVLNHCLSLSKSVNTDLTHSRRELSSVGIQWFTRQWHVPRPLSNVDQIRRVQCLATLSNDRATCRGRRLVHSLCYWYYMTLHYNKQSYSKWLNVNK